MKCPKCGEIYLSLTDEGDKVLDELGYSAKKNKNQTPPIVCKDCGCKLVKNEN